ncbi:BnaC06g05790D [Brassica napus]|uniref:BnaC06g05790D protein n=2 Tax=Brassica TaxID=3705 RepID=A0A078GHY4_BRANA|nr:BnaC06g05790D [Brassica napus]VDD60471.1 unnamed protein product [Brassica oleracea]
MMTLRALVVKGTLAFVGFKAGTELYLSVNNQPIHHKLK